MFVEVYWYVMIVLLTKRYRLRYSYQMFCRFMYDAMTWSKVKGLDMRKIRRLVSK